MGCDLVFKINGELNQGVFEKEHSLPPIIIKNSDLESNIDENATANYRNRYEVSLLNVVKELLKTENSKKLNELINYLDNLKTSRSVSSLDIKRRGMLGNYKYSAIKAKYSDNKKVTFPTLQTPYNPDILLIDELYLDGKSYKDTVFSNSANGNLVFVVTDSEEGINKLNRHLLIRDIILNNFEENEKIGKLMPELSKYGKNFSNLTDLLLDFLYNNSDYLNIPGAYGLLTETIKNLENNERIGYESELDSEFVAKSRFPKKSKNATIPIKTFVEEILKIYAPELIENLNEKQLEDPEILKELFIKLNDSFTRLSLKFVDIDKNTITYRNKYRTLGDEYGFTYKTIKELIRHTNEVYKGFHIYEWSNGSETKYLYSRNVITPNSSSDMYDSVDQIHKLIDRGYLNKFTFNKIFDIAFRVIPSYERINEVFSKQKLIPGSVIQVLDIKINKDITLNEDEKKIINGNKTLNDFYDIFRSQLTESQFGLLKTIVDSIETAGIFTYLINEKAGSDISSRNLKENNIFSDIIQIILDAKDKMKYKLYLIQSCNGSNNKYYVKVIPISDSVEMHEKYLQLTPIIGLINEVVDVFNDKFGIGATILNSEEIQSLFPDIPANTKAFIQDGKIYINASIATSEDVIHEYTHLILGALKALNFDMYMNLLDKVVNRKDVSYYVNKIYNLYSDSKMADSDMKEEIFVAAFANFLAGKESSNIFKEVKKNVDKEMKSIFNIASKKDFDALYKGRVNTIFLTFSKDIGKIGSGLDFSKGRVYRQAANWISKQLKDREIIENCKYEM